VEEDPTVKNATSNVQIGRQADGKRDPIAETIFFQQKSANRTGGVSESYWKHGEKSATFRPAGRENNRGGGEAWPQLTKPRRKPLGLVYLQKSERFNSRPLDKQDAITNHAERGKGLLRKIFGGEGVGEISRREPMSTTLCTLKKILPTHDRLRREHRCRDLALEKSKQAEKETGRKEEVKYQDRRKRM